MKYFTFLRRASKTNAKGTDASETSEGLNVATQISVNPITVWSEKISGCGEDAEPVVLISADARFGVAAVFDGLGGSGAGRFELSNGSCTGARLAASIARTTLIETVRRIWLNTTTQDDHNFPSLQSPERQLCERRLRSLFAEPSERRIPIERAREEKDWSEPDRSRLSETFSVFATIPNPSLSSFDSAALGNSFDSSFTAAMLKLGDQVSTSRIKSRLKRHLPTTFAGAFFSENEGKTAVKVFWAGDSRVYFLCSRGLFQLSADHAQLSTTGIPDLSGDTPLTQVISEQVPNKIDSYDQDISEPGFLIACTDGAYAYFETAVHFELALWSALARHTQAQQTATLETAIGQVTQDDASMAIIPVGFDRAAPRIAYFERQASLEALQKRFDNVVSTLSEIKPRIEKLQKEIHDLRVSMQALTRSRLGVSEG